VARLGRTIDEYAENGGWSSHFFAENAQRLMRELTSRGVELQLGRTTVHLKREAVKLKVYVHHNGRTEEYATVTAFDGRELLTVHYKDFDELESFIMGELFG
jgi:hypothetical protein